MFKSKEPRKEKITKQEEQREDKKKHEINEIIDQLNNNSIEIKRQAIRRIISAMTLGKDVSMLFSSIVKNMETQNLELKKLIYLYIINYAKSHPDLAIMAINTFCKDAIDKKNPFLRGLAVRTMGCLRVKHITDYLIPPLKEALNDEDSYVRKTGVLCVAKLYDSNPELINSEELIKVVNVMLRDGNAMVVANAVICLQSIHEKGGPALKLDFKIVSKMLLALNEASEWGQTIILDAIGGYTPDDPSQAERILERVSVQTTHRNAGVVLSSIRVMMRMLDYLDDTELVRNYCRRITPSLITLLSAENEIKFAALKNISLIAEKRPIVVEEELNHFFCNFSDPFYVKCEKLEIIVKLANESNIDQILHELKEYVAEVDIDFVRKCIKAIGHLAIKIEASADKCVQALWDCLKQKSNLILQESIIVSKDIFRRYPRKYDGILQELCNEIKTIDEPESRASLVWIIGEYIEDIENAGDLLASFFLENFREESPQVQLQILTACVRLCLVSPQEGKPLLMKIFKILEDYENVDIRDRGYFYWRLLSANPELAKQIICQPKPEISEQGLYLDPQLLDKLIDQLDTLACIYTKPPQSFVRISREFEITKYDEEEEHAEEEEDEYQGPQGNIDSTGNQMGTYNKVIQDNDYLNDLIDTTGSTPAKNESTNPPVNNHVKIPYALVLAPNVPGVQNEATGLAIQAAIQLENQNNMFLYFRFMNNTGQELSDLCLKFNSNSYCLSPGIQELELQSIPPNVATECRVPLDLNGTPSNTPPDCPMKIQVALNTSIDIFVFYVPCSFSVLLRFPAEYNDAKFKELLARPNYIKTQNTLESEHITEFIENPAALIQKFTNNNFQFINKQMNNGQILLSFVTQTVDYFDVPVQLLLQPNARAIYLNYLVPHPAIVKLVYQALKFIVDY